MLLPVGGTCAWAWDKSATAAIMINWEYFMEE